MRLFFMGGWGKLGGPGYALIAVALLSLTGCLGGRAAPGLAEAVDAIRRDLAQLRADLARGAGDDGGAVFTLQLLHASDMDGTTGALQNVENFSAILSGFRNRFPVNTLVVSSGDNFVRGPRYYVAGDAAFDDVLGAAGYGRADIALLNAMGFQASALGNHELDRGTAEFASIIRGEVGDNGAYPGARFPYLAGNLDFSGDDRLAGLVVKDGQDAALVGGGLAGSAVAEVGGERIGIVGATTPFLADITRSGGIRVAPAEYSVDRLAAVIQESVDGLTAQGINKVVLLAHLQRIEAEQALAGKLRGVDIIVAGGSNTLLADATDRLRAGDEAAGEYPLRYRSASGEPALVVNTDADYRYLGRLVVDFDAAGRIIPDSVDPYLSGVYATDVQGGQLFAGRPIPEVSRIAGALRGELRERDGKILGRTAVYLSGSRGEVRTQETNLGSLATDAYLWLARRVDPETRVAVSNGGGIRADIGLVIQPPGTTSRGDAEFLPPPANPVAGKERGDVSQLDAESSLRFNNGLVIIPLTAKELVGIMEHAISPAGVGEVPAGQFPQVAGMRFSFDPGAPAGRRIRSLAIVDGEGEVTDRVVVDGALSGDPEREIKVVTLSFLANRGDGYPFPLPHPGRVDLAGEAGQFNAPDPDFPDTNGNGVIDGARAAAADPGRFGFSAPGTEQDAFAEFMGRFYADTPFDVAETPALEDGRIQNLGLPGKTDTVFMP